MDDYLINSDNMTRSERQVYVAKLCKAVEINQAANDRYLAVPYPFPRPRVKVRRDRKRMVNAI